MICLEDCNDSVSPELPAGFPIIIAGSISILSVVLPIVHSRSRGRNILADTRLFESVHIGIAVADRYVRVCASSISASGGQSFGEVQQDLLLSCLTIGQAYRLLEVFK
jgi:hypothetical protein